MSEFVSPHIQKQSPFGCVKNTDTSFGGQNFISQSTPLTGGAGTQRHTRRAHSQVYLKGKVQQEYPSQTKNFSFQLQC